MTKQTSVFAALLCCLVPALASAASPGPERSVDDLLREAALVFEGKVIDVSYRMSDPGTQPLEPRPHTFVTYQVTEVLKGSAPSTFTLRFLGGPIDKDVFLRLPDVPLFDVGDHDVLMVLGNEQNECPLVGCSQGRFRFVDDFVVNEFGQRLQMDGDAMTRGPAMRLPAVDQHDMGGFHLERSEADAEGNDPRQTIEEARASRDPARDPSPEKFGRMVRKRVELVHTTEELEQAKRTPERNSDPRQPFTQAWIPRAHPVDPNEPDPGEVALREQEARGNPEAPAVNLNIPTGSSSGAAGPRSHGSALRGSTTSAASDQDATPATSGKRDTESMIGLYALLGLGLLLGGLSFLPWSRSASGQDRRLPR